MRVEHIGDCTLYLGDCREVLADLGRVDAVVTDPPYGINLGTGKDKRSGAGRLRKDGYASYDDTRENFIEIVVPAISFCLSKATRGAVFITKNLSLLPEPDAIGGVHITNAVGRHCWGFNSLSVLALYGIAPDLNKGARHTVIDGNECAEKNGHPCPKPLRWLEWAVDLASKPGEIVIDPFMGSGTTGVACATLGRKFIGIEVDEAYFNIACNRIATAYAQGNLFISSPKQRPTQERFSL